MQSTLGHASLLSLGPCIPPGFAYVPRNQAIRQHLQLDPEHVTTLLLDSEALQAACAANLVGVGTWAAGASGALPGSPGRQKRHGVIFAAFHLFALIQIH